MADIWRILMHLSPKMLMLAADCLAFGHAGDDWSTSGAEE